MCATRVGNLNGLYIDLINNGITDVRIIAVGKEKYASDNASWTNGNILPIVIDPSNSLHDIWGAESRDIFFFDRAGSLDTMININDWDYNKIYSHIESLYYD